MALYVDIEKTYGRFHLRMKFESGNEVLSLLGASGCGKSLTLKCIAGIETPDRGRIVLDGRVLFDSEKKINLSPQKRKVGYLFQQYALFQNMTVYQNIAVGIRKEQKKAGNVADKVYEILAAMGLSGMEQKYPHQLSGGQQQRVALARIILNEPDVLLLDEPFSALDSHLRFQMEQQVRDVIRRFGKSVVLVSHNRDEVFRLSDSIAVVADGQIETYGTKQAVFREPATKNGAILTGCKNISRIKKIDDTHMFAEDWNLVLRLDAVSEEISHVGIRMKYIRALAAGEDQTAVRYIQTGYKAEGAELYDEENCFCCRVAEVIENPFSYTVMLEKKEDPGPVRIGWEMVKDAWEQMETDEVTICMPSHSILLLREGGNTNGN